VWFVVVLGVLGIAAGWLIGRPRAMAVTVVVPVIAIVSRIEQTRRGYPPETWTASTLLFTAGFAALVAIGIGIRCVTRPRTP
jgi:hypothetical protein